VLVDVATMVTAGGETIADIDTLRHQRDLLGTEASPPTVWRALNEPGPASLKRIEEARVGTRARVWGLIPGGLPASRVAGTTLPADLVVLDVDATIVMVHSEREDAARTFEKTFGYHSLGVLCDNAGEFLAASLRPGYRPLQRGRRPPRCARPGHRPSPRLVPAEAAGAGRRR